MGTRCGRQALDRRRGGRGSGRGSRASLQYVLRRALNEGARVLLGLSRQVVHPIVGQCAQGLHGVPPDAFIIVIERGPQGVEGAGLVLEFGEDFGDLPSHVDIGIGEGLQEGVKDLGVAIGAHGLDGVNARRVRLTGVGNLLE
jgi:hypothetical protein